LWAHRDILSRMPGREFSRMRGTDYARKHLGLPVRDGSIVRKCNPQGHPGSVEFLAGHQHPAAGNVQCFAKLGFLAERTRPAQARGQPELGAVVLASVHNPPHYDSVKTA
jgi:hypothetical protein